MGEGNAPCGALLAIYNLPSGKQLVLESMLEALCIEGQDHDACQSQLQRWLRDKNHGCW